MDKTNPNLFNITLFISRDIKYNRVKTSKNELTGITSNYHFDSTFRNNMYIKLQPASVLHHQCMDIKYLNY